MKSDLQSAHAARLQKYVVQVTGLVDVSAELVVEADDPEQARYIAVRRAQNEKLKWRRLNKPARLLDVASVGKAE